MSQRQKFYYAIRSLSSAGVENQRVSSGEVVLITLDQMEAEGAVAKLYAEEPDGSHCVHEVFGYPPPVINPDCRCRNAMAAMVCPNGHMTECHYPYTCREAQCGHLSRSSDAASDD